MQQGIFFEPGEGLAVNARGSAMLFKAVTERALAPGGVAHTFGSRAGEAPARLLIIHAPAAEAYFVELQELWSRSAPPSPEEERALMRRHGFEPVEPPASGR